MVKSDWVVPPVVLNALLLPVAAAAGIYTLSLHDALPISNPSLSVAVMVPEFWPAVDELAPERAIWAGGAHAWTTVTEVADMARSALAITVMFSALVYSTWVSVFVEVASTIVPVLPERVPA